MTVKKTALYDRHVAMGAQMVEFKNTLLPVRFHSEIEEHEAVRNRAGIFDVSHMGEFSVAGDHARDFLQAVLTNNIDRLAVNEAQYSLMLNEQGGVIDDLIVYRLEPALYLLCVNAGNIDRDWRHINEQAAQYEPCNITNVSDQYAQFALQGPESMAILHSVSSEAPPNKFTIKSMDLAGVNALVARTGYTGEDGVEIFVKNPQALTLYDQLLTHGHDYGLIPCGLAARDSLRLEAGLLLHGQDMNETVKPNEVGLMFAVDMTKPEFVGKQALEETVPQRKLVGFKLLDKGIARHDFAVLDSEQNNIGVVTSASYLSKQKLAIGFAIIEKTAARIGNRIFIDIRGRHAAAEICSTRFKIDHGSKA